MVLEIDYDGLVIRHAPDEIEVSDHFLERWVGLRDGVTLGDGILTVRATNGTVSYGLDNHDSDRHVWHGVKSA
jgi:hypothetical protein